MPPFPNHIKLFQIFSNQYVPNNQNDSHLRTHLIISIMNKKKSQPFQKLMSQLNTKKSTRVNLVSNLNNQKWFQRFHNLHFNSQNQFLKKILIDLKMRLCCRCRMMNYLNHYRLVSLRGKMIYQINKKWHLNFSNKKLWNYRNNKRNNKELRS